MNKRRHYQPPAANRVEQYAKAICQTLAKTDKRFSQPEVAAGFAEYVKVVSEITVRVLNEKNNSDGDTDQVDKAS